MVSVEHSAIEMKVLFWLYAPAHIYAGSGIKCMRDGSVFIYVYAPAHIQICMQSNAVQER